MSNIQSVITIKFDLPSLVFEDRVKRIILFRDQWDAKGNGGESPFFEGSATTLSGRAVKVKFRSNYHRSYGWIALEYPECSPRTSFGLLTQILEELLGTLEVQKYSPVKPPVPFQWQGISVECDGVPLQFEWTLPQPWGDWFWQPVSEKKVIIADEYDECDIA
jgi:hypothetical protein